MQVNPNVEYNQEDAGLSLDNEPAEQSAMPESSAVQDETELSAVEKNQKDIAVKGTQVISSSRGIKYTRRDDKLIAVSAMIAGVFAVVIIYAALVFI